MRAGLGIAVLMVFTGSIAAADEVDVFAGLERQSGLFTLHRAPAGGKVLATLPAADAKGFIGRYIYAVRLASGVGSNPLGLDRGLGDSGRLLTWRRVGDQVLAEIDNTDYRAVSDDADERRAVYESFARSVIFATPILSSDATSLTIDLTKFVSRDAFGLATHLAERGQGAFRLDPARSFATRNALAFPDNVEIEALLTFASSTPGDEIVATTPDPTAVSLLQHHSFVRLPEAGFRTRRLDPRSAAINIAYYDFAQPLTEPLTVRLARRYRLNKITPGSAPSPVEKPIVFYVDRGAPEPIRSALIEGASWWADAFTAAGFEDAYEVRLLPEGAHPMDIRYNVIQWVHRQTRGWSYGGGVADPRTGEMLKGHVILGSQRVRQDRMIFESLVGAALNGSGSTNDPSAVALARIRQLAAHEVGHSLGFEHNMAASSNGRASVMDYPAPLITLEDSGSFDLSEAYTRGIGDWDKFTVAWLYSEFDTGTDVKAALNTLVQRVREQGLDYVADAHSRPLASAHPRGSLWDNGADAIEALEDILAVRAVALAGFDADALGLGRERADLATVFAPLYLLHRYQTEAAAKFIGGAWFDYAINGQDAGGTRYVSAAEQRRALDVLLVTLSNYALAIPPTTSALLQPALNRREPIMGRERIATRATPLFDPAAAAAAGARITLRALLATPRLNRVRLAALGGGDDAFTVNELLAKISDRVFRDYEDPAVGNAVRGEYLTALAAVLNADDALPAVAAAALTELTARRDALTRSTRGRDDSANALFARQIERELERALSADPTPPAPASVPPGSPIGQGHTAPSDCWHCDSADLLGL